MTADNCRKEEQSKAQTEDSGQKPVPLTNGAMADKTEKEEPIQPSNHYETHILKIEGVVSDCNMKDAIKAVKSNKGAPGVDGITTAEIDKVMEEQWPKIKQDILDGNYRPSPVRRVEIPKPDGKGVRKLGIPTVLDRIIQQAIHQIIVYAFDPTSHPTATGSDQEEALPKPYAKPRNTPKKDVNG